MALTLVQLSFLCLSVHVSSASTTVQYELNCAYSSRWLDFQMRLPKRAQLQFWTPSEHLVNLAWEVLTPYISFDVLDHWKQYENKICSVDKPPLSTGDFCMQGLITAAAVILTCWLRTIPRPKLDVKPVCRAAFRWSPPADTFDFVEESNWPLGLVDVMLLCEAVENGQSISLNESSWFLSGLASMPSKHIIPSLHDIIGRADKLLRKATRLKEIRVWEAGIHLTQSVEVLSMLHRAALHHLNVTLCVRNLVDSQYPSKLMTDRCALYNAAGMKCPERVDDALTSFILLEYVVRWGEAMGMSMDDIDQFSLNFDMRATEQADLVDLIVVTSMPLMMMAALTKSSRLGHKPVIYYVSGLVFDMLDVQSAHALPALLADVLKEANQNSQVAIVGLDQMARIAWQDLGVHDVWLVPGLSLYTGRRLVLDAWKSRATMKSKSQHQKDKSMTLLIIHRPNERELGKCIMRRRWDIISNHVGKLALEVRRSYTGYDELGSFGAVALFTHTYFIMTYRELYNLNVPIFIPRNLNKHLYGEWYRAQMKKFDHSLVHLSQFVQSYRLAYHPLRYSSWAAISNNEIFFEPHLGYFDSIADLCYQTSEPLRLQLMRDGMAKQVRTYTTQGLLFWARTLSKVV